MKIRVIPNSIKVHQSTDSWLGALNRDVAAVIEDWLLKKSLQSDRGQFHSIRVVIFLDWAS